MPACFGCWRGVVHFFRDVESLQTSAITTPDDTPLLGYSMEPAVSSPKRIIPDPVATPDAIHDLFSAIESGAVQNVIDALESGANPNQVDKQSGNTPLTFACKFGYDDIVAKLLQGAAEAELEDDHGETPLLVAVKAGASAAVHLLITAGGADPVKRIGGGLTALQVAAETGNHDVFSQLLQGATVHHSRTASRIGLTFIN